MTKLQLSQHFCRATEIFCLPDMSSCRVGVTLQPFMTYSVRVTFIHLEDAIHAFSI